MDPLRSNLSGYYSPQQYTPVPLPTYPTPNFSTPSPYPRHHAIQVPSHIQHQHYDLDQTQTLTLPQSQSQLVGQAEGQPPTHIQGLPQAATSPDEESQVDEDKNNNVVNKKPKGGSAPKGFGRTSAVYRIDDNGVKRRVNAEDFQAEVEERTRNGESCEQIADALIAQGAQVTSKSISRWRIQWGYRKRAVRKQSKPPKPQEERMNKKQIFQSKFKADITRMTQQGFTAEQIAQIMTSRGMELKKGSSTIARLQTVWKLRGTEESRIKNKRYLSRRKARQQQLDEFNLYAQELELENPEEWVRQKMKEPAVKDMRRDAAFELMGDVAPEPKAPKESNSKAGPSRPRTKRSANAPTLVRQASAIDAQQHGTEIGDECNDGEELTVDPAVITRTLRSDRAPANHGFRQDAAHTGSQSNGKDLEYKPMEGVSQAGNYDLADDTYHDYQALVDPENDDGDDDDGDDDGEDDGDDDDDDNDDDSDDDDDNDDDNDVDDDDVDEDNDQNMEGNILSVASTGSLSASQPSGNLANATVTFTLSAQEQHSLMQVISIADVLLAAAQSVKDVHLAKSQGRPGPRSRTGLPPSVREMESARHRLKEAAEGTLNFLQHLA